MEPTRWYDQDSFWDEVAPFLFNEQRLLGTAKEIDLLIELTGMQPGMQVLDMPCGVGRHACELAQRGFQVTAVDRTAAYLKRAEQLASESGVQIEFIQEDMRAFRRPGAFDLALNLFTSFGYFVDLDDERGVLANYFHSLKPGGKLVMEMMGKEILARIFQQKTWQELDGLLFLQERQISDGWDWIENRWIIIKDCHRRDLSLGHRLYSAVELRTMIQEAGFSQVRQYGGMDGIPYDQNALSLIALAQK